MKACCVILARKNSKGIRDKNLQAVGGKLLIEMAIEAAEDAVGIEHVCVSTDDDRVAAIAHEMGASAIRRPSYLATDTATSADALLHADAVIGVGYDTILLLQPNAYPHYRGDAAGLLASLEEQDGDSAILVRRHRPFVFETGHDGYGKAVFNMDHVRRQDLPIQYEITGAAFAVWRDSLREYQRIICGRVVLVEARCYQVDIDRPDDLTLARSLHLECDGESGPCASI